MFDWKGVGLKAGVEIHQQLDTGKLFCGCSSDMKGEPEVAQVVRKQHPVPSELGQYDVSAVYEELRDRRFYYSVVPGESCLVELDEEPPHSINQKALEAALVVASAFNSLVFDEFHVMRKTITDGSNTGAFQRTIMISKGGYLEAMTPEGKTRVELEGINLEEDAANILWRKGEDVGYGLSRLGIPLVEIGTEAFEASPESVAEVAKGIGLTLRATGRVKRGLGTIRQDVNVSVRGGRRVEIKGVQDLRSLPDVVKGEAERQLGLIELSKLGLADGVSRSGKLIVVRSARKYLDFPLGPTTLRQEILDMERAFLISIDLRGDGDDLELEVGSEGEKDERKREQVEGRLRAILSGPSEETRAVVDGARTIYTRPLPGGARMYPETDIPPIRKPVIAAMPAFEPYYVALQRIREQFSLDEAGAEELYTSPLLGVAKQVLSTTSLSAAYVASVLLGITRSLEREGVDVSRIRDWHYVEVFKLVDAGFPKEGVPDLLKAIAQSSPSTPGEVKALADKQVGGGVDLRSVVEEVIAKNEELIRRKGMGAYGALMGDVMRIVRGKVDGKRVSEELRRALEQATKNLQG